MTRTPSFRDVEKLSAYLDGQLKPSEIARLEARLQTDPELASVLKDLRETRSVLRQLPQRRAPRNFTLTPQMVGQKPPMPRTYPVFRFASALATLLFFLTYATNFLSPRFMEAASPAQIAVSEDAVEPALALETAPEDMIEPAAPGAPAEEAAEPAMQIEATPESPALVEEELTSPESPPSAATEDAVSEGDSARIAPTIQPNGMEKSAPGETYAQNLTPDTEIQAAQPEPLIGISLQIILAGIAIASAIIALTLRYTTIRKWRAKA